MASDYGLNFGFRRSDESMARREGRFKTPAASALRLGKPVEIDSASAGYLAVPSANAAPVPGFNGLLVQEDEHIDFGSGYTNSSIDSYDLGVATADRLSAFWFGSGVKVWMKNTPAITRADGRVIAAVTMWDPTSADVGTYLGWDGTDWVNSDGTTTPHWMVITALDTGTAGSEYVEAVLLN